MDDISIPVEFTKRAVDEDQRLVGGFAYVSKKGGELLTDTQGDSITPEVMREAVHEFMKTGRTMGVMHMPGEDGTPISGRRDRGDGRSWRRLHPPGMTSDVEGSGSSPRSTTKTSGKWSRPGC